MKKQTIKHYKAEFDHWINGGTLLDYFPNNLNPIWENNPEEESNFFNFLIKDCIYIINDEYVELRKAKAEGKTIQYNTLTIYNTKWNDIFSLDNITQYHIDHYRIKPESDFKIGDWITTPGQDKQYNYINFLARVIGEDSCEIIEKNYNNYCSDLSKAKPWEPIKNEWCIFYYNKEREYIIAKYVYTDKHALPYIAADGVGRFDNIAPLEFAETLKNK